MKEDEIINVEGVAMIMEEIPQMPFWMMMSKEIGPYKQPVMENP